jgi:hypothetical protein
LQSQRQGRAVDWPESAELVLLAWRDLVNDRNLTGGLRPVFLPITFAAIDQWARRFGVDGDAFETLCVCLRAMDAAYLDHRNQPPDGEEEGD